MTCMHLYHFWRQFSPLVLIIYVSTILFQFWRTIFWEEGGLEDRGSGTSNSTLTKTIVWIVYVTPVGNYSENYIVVYSYMRASIVDRINVIYSARRGCRYLISRWSSASWMIFFSVVLLLAMLARSVVSPVSVSRNQPGFAKAVPVPNNAVRSSLFGVVYSKPMIFMERDCKTFVFVHIWCYLWWEFSFTL